MHLDHEMAYKKVQTAADDFCDSIKVFFPDRWDMGDWILEPKRRSSDIRWKPATGKRTQGETFFSSPSFLMFFAGLMIEAAHCAEVRKMSDHKHLRSLPLPEKSVRNYLIDHVHHPVAGISPRDAIAHNLVHEPHINSTMNARSSHHQAFLDGCRGARRKILNAEWGLSVDLLDVLAEEPITRHLGVKFPSLAQIFTKPPHLVDRDTYIAALIRIARKIDIPKNPNAHMTMYLLSVPCSFPECEKIKLVNPENGQDTCRGWSADSALYSYALTNLKKGKWIFNLPEVQVRKVSDTYSTPFDAIEGVPCLLQSS